MFWLEQIKSSDENESVQFKCRTERGREKYDGKIKVFALRVFRDKA
jgi:hypothetical protein